VLAYWTDDSLPEALTVRSLEEGRFVASSIPSPAGYTTGMLGWVAAVRHVS